MSLPHFVAIVFFVCAICLVSKGKLPLRFSFFWLSLSVIILIAAIFPWFHWSNWRIVWFLLLAFSLMLSVIVTKQAASIKDLT